MLKGAEQKLRNIPSTSTEDGKRIFPAIDILKSGTRNDHLLLNAEEKECVDMVRKATNSLKPEESVERILDLFAKTKTNREFIDNSKRMRFF